MAVNVLSAVFLSKYDFTGISSVLGIIVILKNFKTIPNQTLFQKEWQKSHRLRVFFFCIHPFVQAAIFYHDGNRIYSLKALQLMVLSV